jgi:hypothetical protein
VVLGADDWRGSWAGQTRRSSSRGTKWSRCSSDFFSMFRRWRIQTGFFKWVLYRSCLSFVVRFTYTWFSQYHFILREILVASNV